jgi:uridine kinase
MAQSTAPSVVVIGIGGCSSSGKTTLSLLLKEIFPNNTIHILYQDTYFLPLECRPSKDSDCWGAIDGHTFVRDLQQMKATGQPVEGEDVDEKIKSHAVFPENLATLEKYKDFIVSMRAKIQQQLNPAVALPKSPSTEALGVFSNSPAKADQSENSTPEKPVICIVDGFLLYTDPKPPKMPSRRPSKSNPTAYWGPRISSLAHRVVSDPISRRADLHSINEDDTYEADDEITPVPTPGPKPMTTRESRMEAMRLLDIKLFLPTSKAAAKDRRFRRTAYMDPPKGRRQADQHWATEAYFETIAWVNYKKENGFLFDKGDVNKAPESATFCYRDQERDQKIMLAPKIDQPIELNVMWAVDVIISEMKKMGIKLAEDGSQYLREVTDYKDRPADWIIDYAEEVCFFNPYFQTVFPFYILSGFVTQSFLSEMWLIEKSQVVAVNGPKTFVCRVKQKVAWKVRMSKRRSECKTEARVKYEKEKKNFLRKLKE